jgi:hypothetical protein
MLQKQTAHLNLTGGLQKKDDEFLVIPSKLAVANDVQFDDANTVIRRGGQSSITLTNLSVIENLSTLLRGFAHQGAAVLESESGTFRLSSGGVTQIFNAAGNTPRVFNRASMQTSRTGSILTKASVSGAGEPLYDLNVDVALIGDTAFYTWETRDVSTGLNSVAYLMMDVPSKKRIISGTLNTISSKVRCQPRVIAVGTKFALYYGMFTSGGTTFDIRRTVFNSSGSLSSAEAVVVTSSAGSGGALVESADSFAVLYDVAVSHDSVSVGLVYRDINAARTLRFYEISTSTFNVTSTSNSVSPSATPTSLSAVVTNSGGTYRLGAMFSVGSTTIRGMVMNQASGALTSEATLNTGAVGSVAGRATAIQSSDGGTVTMACDSQTATLEQSTLRVSTMDVFLGSVSEGPVCQPWYIAGRITSYNSRLYLPMMFCASEDTAENSYFVIDLTSAVRNIGGSSNVPPYVVARIDYGEGAMFRSRWRPHLRVQTTPATSTGFIFPYVKFETDLVFAGTTNDTSVCVSTAAVDFTSQLGHEEINGITFLAGACPMIYDGLVEVEENFHHAPFISGNTGGSASGTYGPFPTGDVTLCFTVGWQDSQGNWHESAPSNEKTVTFGVGTEYWTPVVVLPPTMKTDYRLRIYRTKASSTDTTLYLSITQQGIFIDTDADLEGGEQLYTSGNVLPNTPAPACRHVSTFQKRLVLSGCGDGSRVHWSKVTTPGYGVEFSSGDPTHQTVVPADKGRVVGTEEMDDFLVVLCENGIGILGGTGPNDSGTQGQYSDFSTKVTETGCSWDSPKSIIRGPEGVWFRSPFGIRLFSRSGGLAISQDGKQAGSEVDSLVSGNVVAIAGDAKQQLRFYQSSGTALVWDYQWKQWTRFTQMSNVDAVYADDRYYTIDNYSTSTPLLRYTDETAYQDWVYIQGIGLVQAVVSAYVETSWLSFAGIQGFQRVYRLMILGKNSTSGDVPVELYLGFDFDTTSPPDDETATATVTPASTGVFQQQHHFAKQKCEALKIGLSFFSLTGRVRLTDLTLQVGVKPGYYKLPSSQRF